MTLVIALACKDGVVMASDSLTYLGSTEPRVRQEITKISSLGSILWGGTTNDMGFVQMLQARFNGVLAERGDLGLVNLSQSLVVAQQQVQKDAIARHLDLYGRERQLPSYSHSWAVTLFADFRNSAASLFMVGAECQLSWHQDFGYAAIGAGDNLAYVLLRKYHARSLSWDKAKLVAYHVIKEAIDCFPTHLSDPVVLWATTEEVQGGQRLYVSRRVQEAEMRSLGELRARWMEQERQLFAEIVDAVKG